MVKRPAGRLVRHFVEEPRACSYLPGVQASLEYRLMVDVGIPLTLKQVGVREDMIEVMADDSLKSGNVPLNPRRVRREDIVAIFKQALG